jgi:glycoprotein endo-alpha-1,2-mannosidase
MAGWARSLARPGTRGCTLSRIATVSFWAATVGALVAVVAAGMAAASPSTGTQGPVPVITPSPPSVRSPLIGAYYSEWFPANAAQGTLRQHLVPRQGADPTKVDSNDPRVAEQAIGQAAASGIGFFALDWWPSRPKQNEAVDAFVRARNLSDIKFCFLYETWDLGFDAGHESTPVTAQLEARFDQDLLDLAGKYFANPSYLRIGGRPVVVLYLTRTLTGDVTGMMTGARRLLKAHGYDPFLIGDEVLWRVTAVNTPSGTPGLTTAPQVSRIDLFDAVTAYSLYSGGPADPLSPQADFENYPGATTIVPDEVGLYRRYRTATMGRVPVVPDVTPGLNTRGVRLSVDEHAQPRQWLRGAPPGSTLLQYLEQIATPVLDPSLPMVFVTSWNEWNEDTAIQPVGGVATSKDDSPSGSDYTQGYNYGGEGSVDLDVIRNYADVAWGRITGPGGRPVPHREVVETARGRPVNATHSDAEGWYVMPRSGRCPATLAVETAGDTRQFTCSGTEARRVDLHL